MPMRRSALERRYRILGPAKPGKSLSPVEAVRIRAEPAIIWLTSIVGEQDRTRVIITGRNQEDTLPSLRHAGKTRIDQPVGPAVIEFLELAYQILHGVAAIENKHIAHVLDYHPARVGFTQQLK